MSHKLKLKDMIEIQNHYKKYFEEIGAKDSGVIIHELDTKDGMHVDFVHYLATEEFPYQIIATMGMSGYKMKGTPHNRMELIMLLPKDWKFDEESIHKEEYFWPFRTLTLATRLPLYNDTFLAVGHTFSIDEDYTPFAPCTDMCAGFITQPYFCYPQVRFLEYGKLFKRKVYFACFTTLNKEEFDLEKKIGFDEFFNKQLEKENGYDDIVVQNHRKSKKKSKKSE